MTFFDHFQFVFTEMALTYKLADHQEISTGVLIMARIIVVLLIWTYFGASFVTCEEEIPFCKDHLKELVKDEEDWSKRCLKYEGHKTDSSCCETEKEYLRKRMCSLSKLCFYRGIDCAFKVFMKRNFLPQFFYCIGKIIKNHNKLL